MPAVVAVERDYPNTYARFTALGPLMTTIGNGGKASPGRPSARSRR